MTHPSRCPLHAWHATTFTSTRAIAKNHGVFTSTRGIHLPTHEQIKLASAWTFLRSLPLLFFALRALWNRGRGAFPVIDPPQHTAYRRLVDVALSPVAVEGMKPIVHAAVAMQLHRLKARSHFDIVQDYAAPIVTQIALHVCGLPESSHDFIAVQLNRMLSADDFFLKLKARQEIKRAIWLAIKNGPHEGFMARLVNQNMGVFEMVECTYAVLIGGPTTLPPFIGAAYLELTQNETMHAAFMADSAVTTEDLLRRITPLQATSRVAMKTADIDGQPIKAGQRVVLDWAAANVERMADNHIAFGYGAHHCPGARLARTVIPLLLTSALTELPDYFVENEELVRPCDPSIGGYAAVPVRLNSKTR